MKNRKKSVEEEIRKIVSEFVNRESNRTSLITITRVDISPNFSKADIFFTVLPEKSEESALNFLKRKRPEVKTLIKKNMNLRRIPFVDFELDKGEKNRQVVFDLMKK